jgi:hypothetical protein
MVRAKKHKAKKCNDCRFWEYSKNGTCTARCSIKGSIVSLDANACKKHKPRLPIFDSRYYKLAKENQNGPN